SFQITYMLTFFCSFLFPLFYFTFPHLQFPHNLILYWFPFLKKLSNCLPHVYVIPPAFPARFRCVVSHILHAHREKLSSQILFESFVYTPFSIHYVTDNIFHIMLSVT